MWIAVALMAAWLMRRWPRPLVALAILASALSPLQVLAWHVTSDTVVMSSGRAQAARWIEASTPERSVFLTDPDINSPVDLAGRLRITTFAPYVANLGYNPDPRAADVHRAYCDGDAAAVEVMRRYGATYVVSSGGLLECDGHAPTDFAASSSFATVYQGEGVTIWKLRNTP